MSKIGTDSNSHSYDSGAFKTVEIFEHFVRKSALEVEDGIDYDEAKQNPNFYDEEDNFHYSWVDNGNDPSPEECYQELSNEFNYIKSKKHLPILVPIVEGDETCYVMPRAKTYYEAYDIKLSDRVFKRRSKEIKIALLGRIRRAGGKCFYNDLHHRIDTLIKLGLNAKLSNKTIINNLYWFITQQASHNLLRDMHKANIGIYRRNIVTFDAGQIVFESESSIRKVYKLDLNHMKWKLNNKIQKANIKRAMI